MRGAIQSPKTAAWSSNRRGPTFGSLPEVRDTHRARMVHSCATGQESALVKAFGSAYGAVIVIAGIWIYQTLIAVQ